MRFTEPFDLERNSDWVVINDGDGSILWRSQDGNFWEMRYERFVSNTHYIELQFDTDGSVTDSGWRLEWGEYERYLDCVYSTECIYQEWSELRRAYPRVGS